MISLGLLVVPTGCAPRGAAAVRTPPSFARRASTGIESAAPGERGTKAKSFSLAWMTKDTGSVEPVLPPEVASDAAPLASASPCPAEMALVDDRVCVDRWEGSLVELAPDGERPWSPFAAVDGQDGRVRAASLPGVIPQGYISGQQAVAACSASGKRLCTSEEWQRACRGPENTPFPYGSTRQRGTCNDDVRRVHPVAEVGALLDIKRSELWTRGMNNPLINQLPQSLLPTGERAECTNAYGVFDMVGNLHEWVDDPSGTFRGGYYMDTTQNGDGCGYATTAHGFTYHDYSTGFRCCMDPQQVE
jgi:formylglycine-generating enzyme